jgi:hypothetical protein
MTDARSSQYEPDFARIAGRLCRNGATDIEVADILGISLRTFCRWCLQHDEFNAAVRVGKEAADDRVERSLYRRAVGYDYTAEKIVTTAGGGPVVMFYTVHVPADVRAALHWLAMRRPRPWARVPEPEADIAHIIGERRKQVAEESERQVAEQQARFKAAVEAEVARRVSRDARQRPHKAKGPPLVATALR